MQTNIDVKRRIENYFSEAESVAARIMDGSQATLTALEYVENQLLRAQILLGLLVAEKEGVKPKFGIGSRVRFKKDVKPVQLTIEGERLANLGVDATKTYTVASFCFYPHDSSSRKLGVEFLEINRVYFPEDILERAQ